MNNKIKKILQAFILIVIIIPILLLDIVIMIVVNAIVSEPLPSIRCKILSKEAVVTWCGKNITKEEVDNIYGEQILYLTIENKLTIKEVKCYFNLSDEDAKKYLSIERIKEYFYYDNLKNVMCKYDKISYKKYTVGAEKLEKAPIILKIKYDSEYKNKLEELRKKMYKEEEEYLKLKSNQTAKIVYNQLQKSKRMNFPRLIPINIGVMIKIIG